MTELERLKEAIGTGEVLRVIYHGGSQPGAVREIVPVSISGDCVWAICTETKRRKSFSIPKIEFCDARDDSAAPKYAPAPPLPAWADLSAFMAETGERFKGMELVLKGIEDENGELVGVGVHQLKKDGSPRMYPLVKLERLTFCRSPEIDAEGQIVFVEHDRVNQWVLTQRGRQRSYGKFSTAARELLKRTIGL